MEDIILKSTKESLGVPVDYTPFDNMLVMHINTAFSVLTQLGLGPIEGFAIDEETKWEDFPVSLIQMNMVKAYLYLKVRMLFDPPTTSFHITSMENQIAEYEARLSISREAGIPLPDPPPPSDGEVQYIPMHTFMEGGY